MNQSGTLGPATPDKAVDGYFDRDTGDDYYLRVCSSIYIPPEEKRSAVWWLDMKNNYPITAVSVYNTFNKIGKCHLSVITVIAYSKHFAA